jgi:hypothetical protein
VVIDISGSIGDDVLEVFFREIHGIWKNDAEVMVLECDADVQRTYDYKGKTPKRSRAVVGQALTRHWPGSAIRVTALLTPAYTSLTASPVNPMYALDALCCG